MNQVSVFVSSDPLLLSGSILAVGMVAWGVMMYLTLLVWSFATSSLLPPF